MRRVVVTGLGLASPIGNDLAEVTGALQSNRSGIQQMPEWRAVGQLAAWLGAPVDLGPKPFPRRRLRTMGRVAELALFATDRAIANSGVTQSVLTSGRTGLSYGSTHGSTSELERFCRPLIEHNTFAGIPGTSYLKIMSHTCAANLAQDYGIRGRVIPSIAACASASLGIGIGYDMIRFGLQDVMICGGAEELHCIHSGVFDIVFAASTRYVEAPDLTPRPFDVERDGLVVAEGAGTLVLEDYDHARRRGAEVVAEIVGFGNTCDGTHVTNPSSAGMASAMQAALDDAKLDGSTIDYVNAHGTATEVGDIAESEATARVLGTQTPISSTKGATGHTLGACGAIEAIYCFAAMRGGFLPANRNLTSVDPRCAKLDYVRDVRPARVHTVMTNNFAFGGINTSLIFRQL